MSSDLGLPLSSAPTCSPVPCSDVQIAKTDPLNIFSRPLPYYLDPSYFGFTESDLDRTVNVEHLVNTKGFLGPDAKGQTTIRNMLERLQDVYCKETGYEYMHIPDGERCNWVSVAVGVGGRVGGRVGVGRWTPHRRWTCREGNLGHVSVVPFCAQIRERIELESPPVMSKEERLQILDRLAWSEHFETFLANKFVAAKRFGLEGAESLIPGMKSMIDTLSDLGAECVVIGMPHRGRLNILGNVVRKPLSQIFYEFSGTSSEMDYGFSTGDVKYHLGTSFNRPTSSGKMIHLSLMANPSHLEAVNTLVLGKIKAKQFYTKDTDKTKNVPVVLHGDGAFAGQGIVYETLDISTVPDYDVGGAIHIVVNNQVRRRLG